jgi:urease accessory protein UreF
MNGTSLAGLLRLADSAFPSGAFSQSFGLESAVAAERVHDESTLYAWLEGYLVDAWATLEGAALVLAMRDGFAARELDAIVTAATHAGECRRANARMTGAILDTRTPPTFARNARAASRRSPSGSRTKNSTSVGATRSSRARRQR